MDGDDNLYKWSWSTHSASYDVGESSPPMRLPARQLLHILRWHFAQIFMVSRDLTNQGTLQKHWPSKVQDSLKHWVTLWAMLYIVQSPPLSQMHTNTHIHTKQIKDRTWWCEQWLCHHHFSWCSVLSKLLLLYTDADVLRLFTEPCSTSRMLQQGLSPRCLSKAACSSRCLVSISAGIESWLNPFPLQTIVRC